jgi:hypothetical protein
MSYLASAEFAIKMVDAGELKILMSTRNTIVRAFIASVILARVSVFVITIAVNTGSFLLGEFLFPLFHL